MKNIYLLLSIFFFNTLAAHTSHLSHTWLSEKDDRFELIFKFDRGDFHTALTKEYPFLLSEGDLNEWQACATDYLSEHFSIRFNKRAVFPLVEEISFDPNNTILKAWFKKDIPSPKSITVKNTMLFEVIHHQKNRFTSKLYNLFKTFDITPRRETITVNYETYEMS